MHYTGVRDGKKVKRNPKKFQHYGFLFHKILQLSVGVYKIRRLALLRAEKSVIKNLLEKKKK